ncbi:hypothetical protein BO86DRAFT_441488 [Aspergillus japonicus CBS 114.51]|uniref:LysM domain-containing protein n=1 Tax=Aspergillus japonicus CBS 114.51 TaxID=1448312 RepID=A0A8T8XAW9_ASPJA|nr:hypothetical protein BO86DRAFT_441488 [Aspergillus japonicus CBS 114.51]RAH84622.1 hypothetical protein BO86DRAFT_441488 [Aspergillus japonicus CBS 114.51]
MGVPISLGVFMLLPAVAFGLGSNINDTLQVYTQSELGGLTASTDCLTALSQNVSCYASLNVAVTQESTWSTTALDLICSANCESSLDEYITAVDDACGHDTVYNLTGGSQTASQAGITLRWKEQTTCLKDPTTGRYCNLILQEAAQDGNGSSLQCSNCTIAYLESLASAPSGQLMVQPAKVVSIISACSGTASLSVTASTSSGAATSATTTSASNSENTRCNAATSWYTVVGNETCVDISRASNVSTPALVSLNALDLSCRYIAANQTLCLPSVCNIYRVSPNDTCASILGGLDREVSDAIFRSWNPSINAACSNLQTLVNGYICVRAVPTNAVTTSNTDCGHWYTIQRRDTCDGIAGEFGISLRELYFLNPQLNGTCASLWVGNSYCVQAVGNIDTYSGYTTSSRVYTTLAQTMDLSVTQTVNRTTTHFFYSYPAMSTSTVVYNPTAYEMTRNYTLCRQALAYYNITSDDQIVDAEFDDPAWYQEYERVCLLNLTQSLPTIPFNTSIALVTWTGDIVVDQTSSTRGPVPSGYITWSASATGGTSTAPAASSSSGSTPSNSLLSLSSATTTLSTPSSTGSSTISPNGLCGATNHDWVCRGSGFGDCCSGSGYWCVPTHGFRSS